MKSAHASLIVFSGLAAFATGEALPPADIPIQCATICGPMVELTALCCPRDKLAKRRRLDEPVRFEGGSESTEGDGLRDDDRLERRKFVTLVPAPKSFPDEPTTNAATTAVKPADAATFPLASAAPSSSSSTSQPAVQEAGTTTAPLLHPPQAPAAPPPAAHVSSSQPPGQPAPTPATALARTTGIALGANGPIKTTTMTTNAAAPSSGSKQLPSSGGSQMEQIMGQPGIPMAMDAEEKCVCLNRSFDVARISGLCASCIMQANDVQNSESSVAVPSPISSSADPTQICTSSWTRATFRLWSTLLAMTARPTTSTSWRARRQ